MLYPAFVELGNDKEAYSVVLPDFDGCFTATDNEDELPKSVQEAVELHFEGEDFDLPSPSKLETLKASGDYNYEVCGCFLTLILPNFQPKPKELISLFQDHSYLDWIIRQSNCTSVVLGLLQSLVEKNLP